mgnify:CR=1 FL=1
MQNNAILLESLTVEQLQQLIGTSVKNGIIELQKELQTKDNSEELMTREETCQFLKIDSSTLWAKESQGLRYRSTTLLQKKRVIGMFNLIKKISNGRLV